MSQSYPPAPVPPAPAPPAPAPQAPYPPAQYQGQVAAPPPELRFGGFMKRFIAYMIDGFIAGIIVVVVSLVLGPITAALGGNDNGFLAGIGILVMLLVVFGVMIFYFPFFWQRSGQTPGMKVLGVRVVNNDDGGPIGWGTALLRLVGFGISAMIFYIGFIWIIFDARKQGWHDHIAGTCVIEV